MVICQFYLKGTCRFGDRCRNEHRKPDNRGFNRQGYDDNYNQGYRNNQNYNQDRKGGGGQGRYSGGGQGRYGGGDQGYDDHYNQGHRNNQNYNQDRKDGGGQGHHGGGGQGHYGGNQGESDGYRGGGNYRNSKYHYDARNTGNSNRFSALSHQPDPEMPNYDQRSQSRGQTISSTNQQSATHELNLERVKKEIHEWNESGQWPLSCYSTLANDLCFNGLVDISPEEVRVEAYKANTGGNSQNYVQSLEQTLEKYVNRKRELTSMSLASLQQEMSKLSQQINATSTGIFGSVVSSPSPFGGNQSSLFGSTHEPAATTSSPMSFGPGSQSSSGPFSSTPFASSSKQVTFGSTLPATNSPGPFGTSSGTVQSSQPLFGTSSGTVQSSQPLFGTSENHANTSEVQTSSMTSNTKQPVVPLLKCSEQDMKAFKADHFVLGAIPECPPPPELC